MFPTMDRERTTIPRTTPSVFTVRYPSIVNAVVVIASFMGRVCAPAAQNQALSGNDENGTTRSIRHSSFSPLAFPPPASRSRGTRWFRHRSFLVFPLLKNTVNGRVEECPIRCEIDAF